MNSTMSIAVTLSVERSSNLQYLKPDRVASVRL